MIKKIPQGEIPTQLNINDSFGDLWATWNIDLTSDLGSIKVSPTGNVKTTSATTGFGIPVAFARNTSASTDIDTVFCVTATSVFMCPITQTSTFSKDTITGTPTSTLSNLYTDAVTFEGSLLVSLNNGDIARLASGNWGSTWWTGSVGGVSLSTTAPHPMCKTFNNLLLIGNDNKVASATISPYTVNDNQIILPIDYEVNWIESSSTTVWIGARNRYKGEGKIFSWDGYSENFNQDYKVGSDRTYACVIKDERPYTLNSLGQLLVFDGGSFKEIARLPAYNDDLKRLSMGIDYYTMNMNGMSLVNGKINMLISSSVDNTENEFVENQLSGIWEYTPETGLYHKNSIMWSNNSSLPQYGSPRIYQAGALFGIEKHNGNYLVGADLYSDYGNTHIKVLNNLSDDTNNKLGYFITSRLYAGMVDEEWQKIYLAFEKMLNSGDSITIKYRNTEGYLDSSGFTQVGTWTSATTFTTTATEFSVVEEGNEVEVISGEGAGLSATITDISENAGTYTCTIDFTLTNASGDFSFRISNWTKIDSISDLVQTWKDFAIGDNSNWIQFKVILYGKGESPIINKLIIQSKPQITIT